MHNQDDALAVTPFEPADEAGVVDLILAIQTGEFGLPVTIESQPDLTSIPAFYQVGRGGFWVARRGHEIVGTIGLRDIGHNQAALRKMFVAAHARGRDLGVAAALLARLLDEARACGVTEVFLGTTERFLAAHRFYEKHGFSPIAQESLPKDFPLMTVDTRFYAMRL